MSHLPDDAVHVGGAAGYPPAPWRLAGQMWLTLFQLRAAVHLGEAGLRPRGLYGAAFVSYEEDSVLTYSELLVARPCAPRGGVRRRRPWHGLPGGVEISDIWVDLPASMAGGRELWAIPKGLCDFTFESSHTGPLSRTAWSASAQRHPIASADFVDVSRAAPRLPLRSEARQPGIADTGGEPRTAPMRGTARMLPCRARWELPPHGPLGWLGAARQLGSCRLAGFGLTFG